MKQALNVKGIEGYIESNLIESNLIKNNLKENSETSSKSAKQPSSSKTLVMIHGWPDTHHVWQQQIDFFKPHYRCVYFTLPGFAQNKPRQAFSLDQVIETIKQVVDEASPEQPVHLLLHDWGCFYGYQYAMRYPDRVASVVGVDVGDATSRNFAKSITTKKAAIIAAYQLPLALAWRIGGKLGTQIARGVAKALKSPSDMQRINANMGYPYFIQWTKQYGSFKGVRNLDLSCPMLYAYGKRKPLMFHSTQWLESLAQQPHCKVQAFDTSHWVMVEAADQFNRMVQDWLSTQNKRLDEKASG